MEMLDPVLNAPLDDRCFGCVPSDAHDEEIADPFVEHDFG
jgi:hypothetical protein